jgi:hypothetical protein
MIKGSLSRLYEALLARLKDYSVDEVKFLCFAHKHKEKLKAEIIEKSKEGSQASPRVRRRMRSIGTKQKKEKVS